MKKLYFLMAALLMLFSTAKADEASVEFTASLFGIGMDENIFIGGREIPCGATTIVFNQGTNGIEAPSYNDAQGCVKFKQGHTMTIKGGTINKVEIWCTSAFNGITDTNTSVSTGTISQSSTKTTWEGSADEIVFTRTQSNPVNIFEIDVYYTPAGAAPAAPIIAGTDNFKGSATVSLTATGDIYYTTNGATPTTSSDLYTGPFTITETTTVKAIAVVAGKSSDVAEATFTKSDIINIADAIQMPNKTTVKVEGTVVATNERGLLIYDGTGYLYYFNAALNGAYAVGDHLVMKGALSTYGGFKQLTNTATVEKTGVDAVKHPKPVTLYGEALDAWAAAPVIENARIAGKLTINGNYYNVEVKDASTIGSVVYPDEALKAKLESDKEYTFTGYLIYTTSNGQYANMVVNDVMEGDISDAKDFVLAYTYSEESPMTDCNVAHFTAPDGATFSITATVNGAEPMTDKISMNQAGFDKIVVEDEEYDLLYFLSSYYSLTTFTVAATSANTSLIEATLCTAGTGAQFRNPDNTTETILTVPSYYTNEEDQYVEGNYATLDLAEWGFRFLPYSSKVGVVKVTYLHNDTSTGIRNVNVINDNKAYNIAGQRVNENQKGIVIMNGKKFINK